jgi:hypothetical protein
MPWSLVNISDRAFLRAQMRTSRMGVPSEVEGTHVLAGEFTDTNACVILF